MRGYPMWPNPHHFHQHSLSSDKINSFNRSISHTAFQHFQNSKQDPLIERAQSTRKLSPQLIQKSILSQYNKNKGLYENQSKQSTHKCNTKITQESLKNSLKKEGSQVLGKKNARLKEKAGYALSIQLIDHGKIQTSFQKENEKKRGQVQEKNSGYGTIHNPCPQKLQPGERIDFSDLFRIGRYWSKFQGSFANGSKSGPGNIYLTNGLLFSGLFENDLANGKGAVYKDGQLKIKGFWYKNKLITQF